MHTTLHTFVCFGFPSTPTQPHSFDSSSRKHKTHHDPLHNHEYHSKQTRVTPSKFRRAEPIPQTRRVRKVLSRYLDSLENGKS